MCKNAMLIFGASSFEHDISIITSLIVYRNAQHLNYNLIPVYIDKNNDWYIYTKENLNIDCFKNFSSNFKRMGFCKAYAKNNVNKLFFKKGLLEKSITFDVALNCCHGGIGENGELVSILNNMNIPVSSQNPTSLGVLMDKVYSKYCFKALKLPVIKFFVFTQSDALKDFDGILQKAQKLQYPIILKPAKLGSSIGISVCHNQEQFKEAINVALQFDKTILVEKAILEGMTEYNVAVMRNKDQLIVSGVDKPTRTDQILSFKDKYIGSKNPTNKTGQKSSKGTSGYLSKKKDFPYPVDEKLQRTLTNIAQTVYTEFDLCGTVRIDFIVDKNNKVYINEVNSIPGSLGYYFFIPEHFKSMSSYINALLDSAIYYHKTQNTINKEFITNLI